MSKYSVPSTSGRSSSAVSSSHPPVVLLDPENLLGQVLDPYRVVSLEKWPFQRGERQFLVWREDAPGVRLGCQVLRRRGRGLLQGPHRQRHGQNQVVVIAFSPRRVGVVARSGYLVAEVLEFRGEGLGLRQLGSDLELPALQQHLRGRYEVAFGHAAGVSLPDLLVSRRDQDALVAEPRLP